MGIIVCIVVIVVIVVGVDDIGSKTACASGLVDIRVWFVHFSLLHSGRCDKGVHCAKFMS